MRKIYQKLLVVIIAIFSLVTSVNAQTNERCGSQEWLEAAFKTYPQLRADYDAREKKLGEAITRRLQENANSGGTTNALLAPVVIPVVFHVVLTAPQQAIITDAMILEQLAVLNRDYAGTNPDSANIPAQFQAIRGHSKVSFVLAQRTPAGTATNGIIRVVSSTLSNSSQSNDPIKNTAANGSSAWDTEKYINVWLGNFTSSTLLGYATFPINSPEGTNFATQQGVVCLAQTIPGGTAAPYNKGRTLTHELGHFFWLRHITGDATCGNDFPNTPGIDDTPSQNNLSSGCPGSAPNVVFRETNCTGFPNPPGRMYQNFMDYTDDACMTMFTNGQNLRTEQAIEIYRPGLMTSDGGLPPSSFTFTTPATTTIACSGPNTAVSNLSVNSIGGYVVPVTLTATAGVPVGATVSFGTNPVVPGNAVTVTLNNTNALPAGTYNITVNGVSGTGIQNVVVSFVISTGTAPTITAPVNQIGCVGSTATFAVTSSITPATYQWQVTTNNGTTWTDIASATNDTYSIAATTAAQNNNQYRAVVKTQCATANSAAALLTVQTAPAITTQPASAIFCANTNATFTVAATGTALTYQWQLSTDNGATWNDVIGANAATITINSITNGQSGENYRVVISGTCSPSVTSSAAILTVGDAASITGNPASTVVCAGVNVNFTVAATGSNLTYQWQVSTNNGTTWGNVAGATAATLTLNAVTTAQNGYLYRAVVFSCTPTGINSTAATLTVNTPVSISAQPADVTLCQGSPSTLSVTAVGTNATYQWQKSTSCTGTWTNVTGATSATLSFASLAVADAGAYRVVITGTCGVVNSNCATVVVNTPVVIGTQPTNQQVCLPLTGTINANFTVAATGTALTYQWQVSTNGGTSFTDITGANAATLTLVNVTANLTGNQYRVVLGGTCTASLTSNAVTLTVNELPKITTQPVSVEKCSGQNTSFSVAATGSTITYQWQVSTNNGVNYANLTNSASYAGVNTTTLSVTNTATYMNGYRYRVVVSGVPCGSVNSASATLTVNLTPTVVLNLGTSSSVNPGIRSTLTAVVSPAVGPYTYSWYQNDQLVSDITSSAVPLNSDLFGTFNVVVSNSVTHCTVESNKVVVTEAPSTQLFVYPNPTNGKFEVRYYNQGGAAQTRTLTIFNSNGAKVYKKQYALTGSYAKMDVNLANQGAGVYFVQLSDASGKTIATGRVVINK